MGPNSLVVEFTCPLCHVLADDPRLAEDGFIYCRCCIENFISSDGTEELNSPMTGRPMGATTLRSSVVEQTIREIATCDEADQLGAWADKGLDKSVQDLISDTKRKARQGDVGSMVILAAGYLFGEQDGIECDGMKGYKWCKQAADQDHDMGKAYLGYCLVAGIGCESDWEDGYEALIDLATQETNADAKDFAAYTLGCCYKRGVYGFKLDEKKAKKWLGKVKSRPTHDMFEFVGGRVAENQEQTQQRLEPESTRLSQTQLDEPEPIRGSQLLFPDGLATSGNETGVGLEPVGGRSLDADACSYGTATTASLTQYSSSTSWSGIGACKRCSRVIIDAQATSSLCLECRTVGGK